ncbi:GerAB/ArcD/ProY family transporter [Tumebacillus sp. ITR2]|uniref:GerAB/ArcD/ProY family transporter n=1 Tax=Tumebacillus amylolyticus TaxID=2801339 RepID=A0ABS1J557_9BACL|nr:GerAB/ArcD/ProY family transporter [Tumebacillus amylolyticus]MBL0385412.1 GerAB/ArcD/ProY family transporter [Tumebacillus amylolyticus]
MTQSSSSGSKPDEHKLRSLGFTEIIFLVQATQVGIGLFNLPRIVVEEAGHSGWISILMTGALVQLALWFIVLLTRRFPEHDLYGILNLVYGKWIGRFLGAIFALYCVAVASLVGRAYIEVVQQWMFPTTSTNMFYLLLLLPCFYAATAGARILGRFGIFVFFATIWMVFLLIAPAREITVDYYFPIYDSTLWELIRASWKVSASAIGFEVLMVYHTFAKDKKTILKASSYGIWITTFIYLVVTVISIGFYSPAQIAKILSPTLQMYQIVELPMIERIEHIGISTWLFLVVNTCSTYLWAAGRYVYSFGKWDEPKSVLVFLPLTFVIGIWGKDVYFLTKFETLVSTIGGIVAGVLPLLVLLSAILFRKRGSTAPPPSDDEEEEPEEVNAS